MPNAQAQHCAGDTLDSDTTIDEKVNPNKLELDGTVNNRNDIVAPIVPASTVVDLDGNAKLGELINQGLSSCTTLNAAGCADAAGSGPGDDSTPGDGGNGDGDDSTPADDDANAPSDGSGSDDNGSSSDDNGSSSGSSNPGSSNSGSGSSDNGDELAFAPPADSNRGGSGSSNSGSSSGSGNSGSGSSDDDDELAFATPTSGQASASSGSATKGDSLPDTGGVSPLMLIAALLFVGLGILLVTKRRRFNS
jgi:LPXTG-motif cell wall-anchored protein